LDEIDARVGLLNFKHKGYRGYTNVSGRLKVFLSDDGRQSFYSPQYTRSIDAQKAIEVEGWYMCVDTDRNGSIAHVEYIPDFEVFESFCSNDLPTEPLARLYCWLCVKQWELQNANDER
jgi:hypothetical protein